MLTVMILAAGRGERLREWTDHLPKPLIPISDKPLIVHLIEKLAAAGVQRIVINLAYRGPQIKQVIGNGDEWKIEILYSEEATALETGGGIVNALPLLGQQPFIVVSGDLFTDYPFATLLNNTSVHQQKALGHLVLVPNPPWHPEGDFGLDSEGWLLPQPEFTYGNIALLHPDLFHTCQPRCFPLAPLLRQAITQKQLTGELYQGLWCNVGTPATLAEAHQKSGTR